MNSFKGDAEKETDCDESHVRPTQKRWIADAVISWPNNDSLASIIEALQALNPQLGLRRAVDVRYGESEYLLYAGVWSDVFEIAFPSPASDDLMSGLTEVNREWWPIETDLGRFQYGPHRLERTSAGSVLVRPRSWHVCNEAGRFGMGYQHGTLRGQRSDLPFDQIGRVIGRWGIFRGEGFGELWEVDYAYLPADHWNDPGGPKKTDREWWETTPIGTISYIDRYDLPFEEHIARAKAIVAAGSAFSILGDLTRLEHRIYRADDASDETGEFSVPEMPWFDIPKILPADDA
jgi:hypothetical protein